MFRTSGDFGRDAAVAKEPLEGKLELADLLLALPAPGLEAVPEPPVHLRLEELEAEVLKLPLDLRHPEAVGKGSVDLSRLPGDAATLLRSEVLERPHVVEPVCKLDQDHPSIVGH